MASEISLKVQLTASKGGATVNMSKSPTITMAGTEMDQGTQVIGTSAEAVTFGEVSTTGFLLCYNMDATNYVVFSMASDATNPFAKLNPGEPFLIPVAAATIYAKANGGNVRIAKASVDR